MKLFPCCRIVSTKIPKLKKTIAVLSCWFAFFASFTLHARTIKITTWNTEWLLSKSDLDKYEIPSDIQARHSKNFTRLSLYARKLNSDIIALQEVGSVETARRILPEDQYDFYITQDNIAQHPVLAIRKKLSYNIIKNPDLTALSKNDKTHILRSGLDLTLYDHRINIRILVVHLKAHCPERSLYSQQKACNILNQQKIIIQKWIADRIKDKQAFIILGDFNRIVSFNDEFFQSLSTESSLSIPTSQLASPCWGGNYFLDGFILDPILSESIIPNTLKVLVYKEKQYMIHADLSDHCPVSLNLSL
ncbi:endonuclease/exonuclease/phosphatase family protein [Commensalibacter sp. ESL0392]|nr:endonuclease/exonuclease/phosphatase family protein [Commensalibacter melissae]